MDPDVLRLATAIGQAGGRALLVGGFVRDRLLGHESKDYDVEVYGLPLERLEAVLGELGEVIRIGRAFGVLRVKGLDIDISLPRRDSKTGRGHRGFQVELDPELSFADAARRRDLTINAMALDPLTDEILDAHGGQDDLKHGVLRATDASKFSEDPLRGVRVAQFAARFEMRPDDELLRLASELDLSELPGERLYEEFRKLLLLGKRPSLGFNFLLDTRLLRFFPELQALVDCPQDPEWHPEGDVWVHTLMVLDEAAGDRSGNEQEDLVLMFAALCHDLGKPPTTRTTEDGRIRSPGHEAAGIEPTRAFLNRLRAPGDLVDKVAALVRHHLAPAFYQAGGARASAYRRLARKLGAVGLDARVLYRHARADHFGRTTEDAVAREFPAGDAFLEKMEALDIAERGYGDVVLGRHLIARGLEPGAGFGPILRRCREIQDETGWDDPERILDAALASGDG
jgi:tRNA nucleotidyltransferase (CCA-adding enzyme)